MEGLIRFGTQHNKKGKYHLIPQEGENTKELCGSKGVLLFSGEDVELQNGKFYEVSSYLGSEQKSLIPDWSLTLNYCKKCIAKAMIIK